MIPPLLPRIATESLVGRKHKNKTRSDQREARFGLLCFRRFRGLVVNSLNGSLVTVTIQLFS
jgi:hypothetical protein